MNCIAIDDEPIALEIIESHSRKLPGMNLVKTFVNPLEAIPFLKNESIELIFLDINMPDVSGVDFAKSINGKFKIIFTTAHSEFAINGFEVGAADYLLKPILFSRFLQACTRVLEERKVSARAVGLSAEPEYLFVKCGYDWERINIDNLHYIEADNNYLTFVESDKKTLTRMKLSDILERLSPRNFIKVHKSFIVALSKVEKIETYQVCLKDKCIPLSSKYRELLLAKLNG